MAIGLLRQQMAPGQMVHGIVTDGGQATNVIPARAEMHYTMRATEADSLRELEQRMADCFLAGAVATGCESRGVAETEPAYHELTPDAWLAETFRAEMVRVGRTPVPADVEAALPLGSTDMGNVTQVMPGIHPIVGHRRRRRLGASAGVRRRGRRTQRRHGRRRGRDHAGAHRRAAGRDAGRARPGAGAAGKAGVMSLHDATELWLDAHYDDLVAWRRHIHAHPELGRQEFATTQFVASHLADAGLNPKVLPGGRV